MFLSVKHLCAIGLLAVLAGGDTGSRRLSKISASTLPRLGCAFEYKKVAPMPTPRFIHLGTMGNRIVDLSHIAPFELIQDLTSVERNFVEMSYDVGTHVLISGEVFAKLTHSAIKLGDLERTEEALEDDLHACNKTRRYCQEDLDECKESLDEKQGIEERCNKTRGCCEAKEEMNTKQYSSVGVAEVDASTLHTHKEFDATPTVSMEGPESDGIVEHEHEKPSEHSIHEDSPVQKFLDRIRSGLNAKNQEEEESEYNTMDDGRAIELAPDAVAVSLGAFVYPVQPEEEPSNPVSIAELGDFANELRTLLDANDLEGALKKFEDYHKLLKGPKPLDLKGFSISAWINDLSLPFANRKSEGLPQMELGTTVSLFYDQLLVVETRFKENGDHERKQLQNCMSCTCQALEECKAKSQAHESQVTELQRVVDANAHLKGIYQECKDNNTVLDLKFRIQEDLLEEEAKQGRSLNRTGDECRRGLSQCESELSTAWQVGNETKDLLDQVSKVKAKASRAAETCKEQLESCDQDLANAKWNATATQNRLEEAREQADKKEEKLCKRSHEFLELEKTCKRQKYDLDDKKRALAGSEDNYQQCEKTLEYMNNRLQQANKKHFDKCQKKIKKVREDCEAKETGGPNCGKFKKYVEGVQYCATWMEIVKLEHRDVYDEVDAMYLAEHGIEFNLD